MSTLKEIKEREKELKKKKFMLELEQQYKFWKDNTRDDDEHIQKFLGSKHGVNWNQILYMIEVKGVEDLKCVLELYKTKRLQKIPYEDAKRYVDTLTPFGFYIDLKKGSPVHCITCDAEEVPYTLLLLTDSESGYGARNSYIHRWVQMKKLHLFKIYVNREMLNEYLKTIQIDLDSLKDVASKIEFIEKKIKDDNSVSFGLNSYSRGWLCDNCLENPDYKKIKNKLKLGFLKPKWLRIEKIPSDVV